MKNELKRIQAVILGAFVVLLTGMCFYSSSNLSNIKRMASESARLSSDILNGYDHDAYENFDAEQFAFLNEGTHGELEADELHSLIYDEDGWSQDKQAHFKTILIKGNKETATSIGNAAVSQVINDQNDTDKEDITFSVISLSENMQAVMFSNEKAAYYAHTECVSSNMTVSYEAVFDISGDIVTEDTEAQEDNTIIMDTDTETASTKPVTIAILDTGYTGDSDRILKGINTVDDEQENTEDDNGHGTRMAEIVTSMTNDNVNIMPIKVANKDGFATITSTYAGILYAIEKDVDIINISMNARVSESSFLLTDAIKQATDAGIKVIVSAGNRSMDVAKITPSNIPEAIVVSSVDINGEFAEYSNYGGTIDYATYGNYDGVDGTSNAAIRMSSMYAYIMGIDGANADELINSAAKNPNDTEWDEYYGYGIVNPYDVYKRADYAFASGMFDHTHTEGVTWKGKTETDLGPGIMDLDWRNISDDDLDLYLRDTHYAFVGEFLSSLSEDDMKEIKEHSQILNSDVEETSFEITDEDVLLSDDLTEMAEIKTPFIDYCLKQYEEHKDDLVISNANTWWWYDNSVGYLYLNDMHGVTKFTISAPYMSNFDEVNHFNSSSVVSGFTTDSVVKGDANKKVIRIGKTSAQSSNSPSVTGARAVSAGAASFISIIKKGGETNVSKSTASAAKNDANGSATFMLQFTFSNYDMGEALEEGHSWYTNFFGAAGTAEAYDFNVRPYGYFAGVDKNGTIANWNVSKANEYWNSHTNSVPVGKKYTASQIPQAVNNTKNQYVKMWQGDGFKYSWVDFFQSDKVLQNYNELTFVDGSDYNNNGNTTETLTERNVLQTYIRLEPDKSSGSTPYPATIRRSSLTTRNIASSDSMDIWYFPGGCNYTVANGLGVIAKYEGESYSTVKKFMKEVAGINSPSEAQIAQYFTRIDANGNGSGFNTFVSGNNAKYLPRFSASDYYGAHRSLIQSFELYKLGTWAYRSVNGQGTNGGSGDSYGNTAQYGTPALFTNESSYDDKKKTLTVSGETFGLTTYAKWSVGEDIVGETDIPEIRIQTTVNSINVYHTVALADKWYDDQDIVNNWTNASKSITGKSEQVMYGQTYTDSGVYAPAITNFKATSDKRITVVKPDGSSQIYDSATNITQLVSEVLAEPGMNGATITIETLYDAAGLSTLYVRPTLGKWTYNGATYTEDNPAIITKQVGTQIGIPNPDINTINYVASFDGNGGTASETSKKTTLSWDHTWTLQKADEQGNAIAGSPNGTKLDQSGDAFDTSVNYMDYGSWSDCSYFDNSTEPKTSFSGSGDITAWWTGVLRNVPTGKKYFMGVYGGQYPRSNIGYGWTSFRNTYMTSTSTTLYMSLNASGYGYNLYKNGDYYYSSGGYYDKGPFGIFPAYTKYGFAYKYGSVEGATDVMSPNISGSTLITLPTASKPNATFLYWKLAYDPELDASYTSRTYAAGETVDMASFKKDVTFVAQWSDNVYTLTLVRDGKDDLQPACTDGDTVAYVSGGRYTKTARGTTITKIAVPTKYGYEFQGYKLGNRTVINADGTFAIDASEYTSDATLYAEWTFKKYKITLDYCMTGLVNEDTADPYMMEYYDRYFEDSKGIMTTTVEYPKVRGKNFEGYYTGTNGTGTMLIDESGNILVNTTYFDADQTLYAKWGDGNYGVQLEFNNGRDRRITVDNVNIPYGGKANVGFNEFAYIPTKPGYTFAGWYDSASGGRLVYNPNTGAKLTGSIYWDRNGNYQYYDTMILYAHWVQNTYPVSYDGNDATSGTMKDDTHVYDIEKQLSKNQYERHQVLAYEDSDKKSSTVMIPIASDECDLEFQGWNSNIRIPNDLRFSQYVSCLIPNTNLCSTTFEIERNDAGLPITYTIDDESIADVKIDGDLITITGKKTGVTTVTLQTGMDDIYEITKVTYYVIVQ